MAEEAGPEREYEAGGGPSFGVWLPGVNYLSEWAVADSAVNEFLAALEEAGVKVDEIQFMASTDDRGLGVVRGSSSVASLRAITRLIRLGAGLPQEEEGWHF